MTELHLAPDRTKFAITKYVDGKVVDADRFDPKAKAPRGRVARAFGVTDDWLLAAIEEVRVTAAPVRKVVSDPVADSKEGTYLVRGIHQTADEAERVEAEADAFLANHLPGIPVDKVAQWKDDHQLVCLDVDYHEVKAPARDWLESVVFTRITPQPAAWHFSRGGGLHLFYKAIEPFAADELAAVAALRFRAIDSSAGLELKTVVRGPGAERVVQTPMDDTSGTSLGGWWDTVGDEGDVEARDEWLAGEEMELGKRYGHSKCPINGEPGYDSKSEPVTVSESGIFCHRCSGMGLSLGCRRAGFAPWPAILGAPSSGDLGSMVRNVAHWGHARWVLKERYDLPEELARRAYMAALKSYHYGKPSYDKIGGIFEKATERFTRVGNEWFSVEDQYALPKDQQARIAALPVAQVVVDGDKGKVIKTHQPTVTTLSTNTDLEYYGYPRLELVHGFKIAKQWLGPQGRVTQVTVVNPALTREYPRAIPRYVLKSHRQPIEEAWKVLEAVVPRIDRTLVTAAICAFGCAEETLAGMLPTVFVEGPSGAAKTSTLRIAAGIYGAKASDVVFDPDPTRMRQSLHAEAQKGPAILLNELLKDTMRAKNGKGTPKDALDFLLNLTPDSSFRGLYRDPVAFGRLPSIWITEPSTPKELRDETQLARRIRHYRVVGNKSDWVDTLAKAKLPSSDLSLIRAASEAVNRACDTIISDVCDTFFAKPTTWDEMADTLGVFTVEKSPNFVDSDPDLRYLFKLVCQAPALTGRAAERYGPGFKKIVPNANEDEDELSSFYRYWADGRGKEFFSSRKLTEKDWGKLLRIPDVDVRWDTRDDGANLYVRFTHGPVTRPTAVNEQIIDPKTLYPEV